MLGWLLVISACGLWALDTLIRYPLMGSGVSAITIVFGEHLVLGSLGLFYLFFHRNKRNKIDRKQLFYLILLGGAGSALGTVAFTQAFTYLNPSVVILLQKLQPIAAIGLASFILKEKISNKFLLMGSISLIGAIMVGWPDLAGLSDLSTQSLANSESLKGYLLVLFSVVSWGSATVIGKKLYISGLREGTIMSGRYFFGLVALIPLQLTQPSFTGLSINTYQALSMLILLSGVFAMYLYYQGLKRISARACTIAELFFPLMAVVVNWIFLDAKLSVIQITGALILLGGSLIIQVKKY